MLIVVVALAFLHHVDHVFRADNSGWPFTSDFTPFTVSLVVYPIFLSDFRAGRIVLAARLATHEVADQRSRETSISHHAVLHHVADVYEDPISAEVSWLLAPSLVRLRDDLFVEDRHVIHHQQAQALRHG